MANLKLPRTHGCLACGRDNPRGLRLELFVDEHSGVVTTQINFDAAFIGFADVVHGGAIATVVDEAMVWAATWARKRFCLCGELSVRYLAPARPNVLYRVEATIGSQRSRLIATQATVADETGQPIATATAKYLPVTREVHDRVTRTFLNEPDTAPAAQILRDPS